MGESRKTIVAVLIPIAVLLPVVAYFMGSALNPTGWMSGGPLYIILPMVVYWPIPAGLLVLAVILALIKRTRPIVRRAALPALMVVSIVYSVALFYVVDAAPKDEFVD